MLVYAIRHGQTDINLEERINGLNDHDLNEEGIRQAVKARDEIEELELDEIICSPLLRTRHTADIVNVKDLPITYDERLQERDAGIFTCEEICKLDENKWWSIEDVEEYIDAETVRNMMGRVYEFLDEIKEKYKDKKLLLVTHGGVMKIIHTYAYGLPENRNLKDIKFTNCEIAEFEI